MEVNSPLPVEHPLSRVWVHFHDSWRESIFSPQTPQKHTKYKDKHTLLGLLGTIIHFRSTRIRNKQKPHINRHGPFENRKSVVLFYR